MEVKYDRIGSGYNSTRRADPYLTSQLVKYVQPKFDGLYLDIGCGTGNYTIAVHKQGYSFIGIDPSKRMLNIAESKMATITWQIGSAEQTNLEDSCVDGVIGTCTIHHWNDLEKGFVELYRILRPGGKLVLFTSTPVQMKGYWLNHYFPKMMKDSIEQMPALAAVTDALQVANFKDIRTTPYFVQENLEDLFLYCGKARPSLYLNKKVRDGISSFSDLSRKQEVYLGLERLKKDIETEKIQMILDQYKNQLGDYL